MTEPISLQHVDPATHANGTKPLKNSYKFSDIPSHLRQYFKKQEVQTLKPTCPHYCTCAESPCVCGLLPLTAWEAGWVLDPFSGSSTALLVSRALGRNAIGVELSATYIDLSRERLGLKELDRWMGRDRMVPNETTYTDLPLFGGG